MRMMIAGLVVVIGLLAGFYGGFKYGQGHPVAAASNSNRGPAFAGDPSAAAGRRGLAGGQGLGGGVSGQITAVTGNTITVHDTRTNQDYVVQLPSGVRISKVTQGSSTDLTTGATVTVAGQTAGNTVTARSVTIGAAGIFGGRRPSPSPSA